MYGQNTAMTTYILKCDLVNLTFKLPCSGKATITVYVGSYVYEHLLFKLVLEHCAGFWRNPFMDGWVSEWIDDRIWHLRFLQQWWWRLKSGGSWCFVIGRVVATVLGLINPEDESSAVLWNTCPVTASCPKRPESWRRQNLKWLTLFSVFTYALKLL